ncbi:MAG: hypothetical protein GTO22_00860 [Gemmatimonadales bacterium]|nr:hypothetical protein [Gemmatimonadales bacterium]
MSKVTTIHGATNFTRNNQTVFTGIGSLIPGESRLLGIRVGIGFGEVAGIAIVTAAVPGAVAGSLTIEQSVDGTNWDHVDSFPMTFAAGGLPFAVKIAGKFVRARFTVPVGEVYDLRFGAQLKPLQSP